MVEEGDLGIPSYKRSTDLLGMLGSHNGKNITRSALKQCIRRMRGSGTYTVVLIRFLADELYRRGVRKLYIGCI